MMQVLTLSARRTRRKPGWRHRDIATELSV